MRRRRAWLGVPLAVILLAWCYCVSPWGELWRAARRLPGLEAQARREGLPLSTADLATRATHASQGNAATDLRFVFEEVDGDRRLYARSPAVAELAWSRHQGLQDQALAALQKPDYFPERDFMLGHQMPFTDYESCRNLATALASLAVVEAKGGRPGRAAALIRASQRCGELQRSEGLLVGLLASLTSDQAAFNAAFDCACLYPADIEVASAVESVHSTRLKGSLLKAVESETAFVQSAIRRCDPLGLEWERTLGGSADRPEMAPPFGPFALDASLATALEDYLGLRRRLARPGCDEAAAEEELLRFERQLDQDKRPSAKAVRLASPLWKATALVLELDRQSRLLLAESMRILQSSQGRTGFPDSWPLPSGSQWVYRKRNGGFQLYSVGPNGRDDGGFTGQGFGRSILGDDLGYCFSPSRLAGTPAQERRMIAP